MRRNLVNSTLSIIAVAVAAMTNFLTACSSSDEVRGIGRYENLPAGAYAVVAKIRAKPGKEAELRSVTLPLVSAVRSEPNNLLYFLHEDREAPGHFVFYEIFATQADFEAHNKTPHVQEWFGKLNDLAEGGVQVVRRGSGESLRCFAPSGKEPKASVGPGGK